MRILMSASLLTAVAIGATGITAGVSRSGLSAHKSTEVAGEPVPPMRVDRRQSSVTVDGAVNPEKISDRVAYLLSQPSK
jgi:hypothetical protein